MGLIPARAGKTRPGHQRRTLPPAHPRACGENGGDDHGVPGLEGSSPRVRGKPVPILGSPHPRRLIPARAGKTPALLRRGGPRPAHPRACGENGGHWPGPSRHVGSSPRVRGKPLGFQPLEQRARLIPARAGKTFLIPRLFLEPWAHPRACGENNLASSISLVKPGSSPRVRGKRRRPFHRVVIDGLIPARAGKTSAARARGAWAWAHPRACGENRTAQTRRSERPGSSPRVRGKHPVLCRCDRLVRLIPARAGKTSAAAVRGAWAWAHPRACGENAS